MGTGPPARAVSPWRAAEHARNRPSSGSTPHPTAAGGLFPPRHPSRKDTPADHRAARPEGVLVAAGRRRLLAAGRPAARGGRHREYLNAGGANPSQVSRHQRWVRPRTVFEVTIRVDGLVRAELGALVWLLTLPDGHALRLGGGKPLGFGAVQAELVGSRRHRDAAAAGRTQVWTGDALRGCWRGCAARTRPIPSGCANWRGNSPPRRPRIRSSAPRSPGSWRSAGARTSRCTTPVPPLRRKPRPTAGSSPTNGTGRQAIRVLSATGRRRPRRPPALPGLPGNG